MTFGLEERYFPDQLFRRRHPLDRHCSDSRWLNPPVMSHASAIGDVIPATSGRMMAVC
jgi:hypothetical protein